VVGDCNKRHTLCRGNARFLCRKWGPPARNPVRCGGIVRGTLSPNGVGLILARSLPGKRAKPRRPGMPMICPASLGDYPRRDLSERNEGRNVRTPRQFLHRRKCAAWNLTFPDYDLGSLIEADVNASAGASGSGNRLVLVSFPVCFFPAGFDGRFVPRRVLNSCEEELL
jgi:hypothetical protein